MRSVISQEGQQTSVHDVLHDEQEWFYIALYEKKILILYLNKKKSLNKQGQIEGLKRHKTALITLFGTTTEKRNDIGMGTELLHNPHLTKKLLFLFVGSSVLDGLDGHQ